MPDRFDVEVETHLSASAATLAPRITEHLLTGFAREAPLRLEESTSSRLGFSGTGGFLSRAPALVVVDLKDQDEGCQVRVSLRHPGARRRCWLWALTAGALLATAAALAMGWLISWSVPAAMITAVLVDLICWFRGTARRGMEARLNNLISPAPAADPGAPVPP